MIDGHTYTHSKRVRYTAFLDGCPANIQCHTPELVVCAAVALFEKEILPVACSGVASLLLGGSKLGSVCYHTSHAIGLVSY